MCDIDDDIDDIKESLDRLGEHYADRFAVIADHVRTARHTVSGAIDACMSSYVDDIGPLGEAFKNVAAQLREAERELSRAEGEADAGTRP
jgi:transposase